LPLHTSFIHSAVHYFQWITRVCSRRPGSIRSPGRWPQRAPSPGGDTLPLRWSPCVSSKVVWKNKWISEFFCVFLVYHLMFIVRKHNFSDNNTTLIWIDVPDTSPPVDTARKRAPKTSQLEMAGSEAESLLTTLLIRQQKKSYYLWLKWRTARTAATGQWLRPKW
jgi:hypothetical protein